MKSRPKEARPRSVLRLVRPALVRPAKGYRLRILSALPTGRGVAVKPARCVRLVRLAQ